MGASFGFPPFVFCHFNCFAVHLSGDNCCCADRLRIKDLPVLTEFNCRISVQVPPAGFQMEREQATAPISCIPLPMSAYRRKALIYVTVQATRLEGCSRHPSRFDCRGDPAKLLIPRAGSSGRVVFLDREAGAFGQSFGVSELLQSIRTRVLTLSPQIAGSLFLVLSAHSKSPITIVHFCLTEDSREAVHI